LALAKVEVLKEPKQLWDHTVDPVVGWMLEVNTSPLPFNTNTNIIQYKWSLSGKCMGC
jgi:hypothetical protein